MLMIASLATTVIVVLVALFAMGQRDVSRTVILIASDSGDPNAEPWGFNYTSPGPTIKINRGEAVRLKLLNGGGKFSLHDFVIPELGIATSKLGAGETDEIILQVSVTGNFTYICSVPGHKEVGMIGAVIVL